MFQKHITMDKHLQNVEKLVSSASPNNNLQASSKIGTNKSDELDESSPPKEVKLQDEQSVDQPEPENNGPKIQITEEIISEESLELNKSKPKKKKKAKNK